MRTCLLFFGFWITLITHPIIASIFSFLILCLCTNVLCSQQLDKNKRYHVTLIGYYNLENLFDTLDTEGVRDEEFTPDGSKKWNTKKYNQKLDNLAEVISQIGTEINPDGVAVLGVSEIENRSVLEDLVKTEKLKKRKYQIVHYDSPDTRGIDVALLYQPKYFKLNSSRSITLTMPGDTAFKTRDQLLVSGKLKGEEIHLMVSHWPSRRGGQKRSQPKRIAAAELGRSVIDSLLAADANAKVFYMGDLNDDPVNASVRKHLNATGNIKKAIGETLFNPMEELFQKGIGTLAWRDNWNLFDQVIITAAVVNNDGKSYRYYGAKVFNKPFLKQSSGKWQGYPFRSFAGSTWLGGYSDHFPVYLLLVKEK